MDALLARAVTTFEHALQRAACAPMNVDRVARTGGSTLSPAFSARSRASSPASARRAV
jgi:hypothetical protein